MINKIWCFFIIAGVIFSCITGKVDIITEEILKSGETSFNMIIKIFPVMALWLGIMNIALKSGLLSKISSFVSPILKFIFPEIPKHHESLGYITTNIVMNMFGLGNAATPFGLKAMSSLQQLNKDKTTASKSMITFLVINTSGVTIVPTTVISLRMLYNSVNPPSIMGASIIVTVISLIAGLIFDRILGRIYK
ncbi:MAG: spore maturation protein [Clostridium sp.]|nr:spore maturation protein [Clostridium sp.]MCM1444226.1 spore maturation protein [Candidatus Amulumruptor caecigallinarius]